MQKNLKKIVLEKKLRKIIILAIIVILLTMVSCFVIAAFTQYTGGFTVNLHFRYGDRMLSLYDNSMLENPRGDIEAQPLERDMYNITHDWFGHPDHPNIPRMTACPRRLEFSRFCGSYCPYCFGNNHPSIDERGGGSHHGNRNANQSNFFAFTFYLRNHGIRAQRYEASINIIDVGSRMDEIIRIVLIRDSTAYGRSDNVRTPVVYAREAAAYRPVCEAGWGGYCPETGFWLDAYADRAFLRHEGSRGTIIGFDSVLAPQEIHRFTIIMYIEGWDPETNNDRLGGFIRLAMEFYAF